ncbi:MAG: acetyl-CoA carboxylase carboxyl transferase subunit alpha/beta [Desulfobulbus propionicus]|nr:MAG: acetyl-CoA carboxylase carboxyl transferase subunit alpha/beta [Desulfobulbus propionicus]
MNDRLKKLQAIEERIGYLRHIKDTDDWGNLTEFSEETAALKEKVYDLEAETFALRLKELHRSIISLEERCEEELTPMERVRIVRSPLRFSLRDILENVYEEYTELGGEGEANVDPAMVVAKANIVRRIKRKPYTSHVMVIGQEVGHGEEFRNGGSCKPWGNAKALRYMKVAETEGLPIHFYIFTPGSYPVEEYPGAAQQIARNIYALTKLRVPTISVISEGGSGGAEAIGLSDFRLMFSHGYYSVISPEGAAAIEGRVREGSKVPLELIEHCAAQLGITAQDNLNFGTIDRIIQEPPLGAKSDDFTFFARVRSEIIRATDEVVLQTKSLRAFRSYEVKRKKADNPEEAPQIDIPWDLTPRETHRLLLRRSKKYREMAMGAFGGEPLPAENAFKSMKDATEKAYYTFRYDILKNNHKQALKVLKEFRGETSILLKRLTAPITSMYAVLTPKGGEEPRPLPKLLPPTNESGAGDQADPLELADAYTSPLAREDRTVTCPNADKYGCKDLWLPDLFGEFAGVCETCGHHFALEHQWYLKNVFDDNSIRDFNNEVYSKNPQKYKGFDDRLQMARSKTGMGSANLTFHAQLMGINLVVSMLVADFRNGTVGAAEGEKFVQACEVARRKKRPFLAYIHTTGGIRIQEGTLGVIQMPKCTMAVRDYIDSGGLYIVVYDNNSYAGPVASFLGCSPYQFAIRSSRIGFAGQRVIRETTGQDIPPDYHSSRNALKRGHIQGIWDRRDFRRNLYKALQTMGSPGLYYR